MKPKYKIRDWLIKPEDMGIDITKVYPIDLTAKKGWKGERQYGWKMTEIHKKIKHLNHTMIVWAENNKYPTNPNNPGTDYIIPPRKENKRFISEWKDDLKFVTKLDRLLGDGKSLTKKELEYCNILYEYYKEGL